MKILILILLAGLIVMFLAACSSEMDASYYQKDGCDCKGRYHCIKGYFEEADYCVRDYNSWDGAVSGDNDFQNNILKCNVTEVVIRNNTYDCWDIRDIILMGIDAPQKEIKIIKVCDYSQYTRNITNFVDWKQIYQEECIGDETD